MIECPDCRVPLQRCRSDDGLLYICPDCSGRMVSVAVLRKHQAATALIREAWRLAKDVEFANGRACAHCTRAMTEVEVASPIEGSESIALDVCTGCMAIWFDRDEIDRVPRDSAGEDSESRLSPKARAALAVAKSWSVNERAEAVRLAAGPEASWQWFPALLGLPVEASGVVSSTRSFVTWAFAALCTVVTLILVALGSLDEAIEAGGFVPRAAARHGCLTTLTSLFLHGGFVHLFGNMYFLLVFGDNVESDLGHKTFAAVLLLAHFAGLAAHAALDPRSDLPVVGASAGISGLLAYYALAFPHARIGIVLGAGFAFRWVRLPVIFAFALWVLFQVLGAFRQVAGLGIVSSAAHLGGAAVGFTLAAALRIHRHRLRRAA